MLSVYPFNKECLKMLLFYLEMKVIDNSTYTPI